MHSESGSTARSAGELEGVAGADVLQLLGDLRRRPVQLLGHALLLVRVHAVELLAQVPVDHVLAGKDEAAASLSTRL